MVTGSALKVGPEHTNVIVGHDWIIVKRIWCNFRKDPHTGLGPRMAGPTFLFHKSPL